MTSPCVIPDCPLPADAIFRVGSQEGANCGMHGYIVMSQFGGGIVEVLDLVNVWKMIRALRTDGYEVATEGVPELH